MELQVVTRGYKKLKEVTEGLQEVSRDYKGLQRVKEG